MNDRLGQGALSEEPSDDALRAQYEWEREQEASDPNAVAKYSLWKLEQVAEDVLGRSHAKELTDPVWEVLD